MAGRDSDFRQKLKEAATAGGVVLAGDHGVDPALLRTFHTTDFRNCGMDVQMKVDDERVVTGFTIRILDRVENRLYTYGFGQESLDAFRASVNELPNVGDKVPEQEGPVLQ